MKKLLLAILFAVLFSVSFVSCDKNDDDLPTPNNVVTSPDTLTMSIYNQWVLIDAYMFVDNLETGEKTKYHHFDSTKTKSSLRFSGSMFPFEDIEQNVTTWEFTAPPSVPGYGIFILNGNGSKPFGFYVTNNSWRITEYPTVTNSADMQIGGSARPISAYIHDYDQQTIEIYVQEAYESINGYNCWYINELIMQKQ